MNWRMTSGRFSLACVFLLGASGCGGGGAQPGAPVKNSSKTKSEAESKPTASGALVSDDESGGSNGDQPSTDDAEAVTIPLDQVWAHGMPGTRDILDLEPEQHQETILKLPRDKQGELRRKALSEPIGMSLTADTASWPREGQTARPGFAVAGSGPDALRAAYEVLVNGDKPREKFHSNECVCIFFFSYQMETRVHLKRIQILDHTIQILYDFATDLEKHVSVHTALIPLGKLPIGKYEVEIPPPRQVIFTPTLTNQPSVEQVFKVNKSEIEAAADRFVCHSFSLSIVD